VTAHVLTMRVALERQAQDGSLGVLGAGIAARLEAVTESLPEPWQNRPATRDAIQQIMALHEHLAPYISENDAALTETLLQLRGWALWSLNGLGDSSAQAIEYGQALTADRERILGETHPDTLISRDNLAAAYQDAGRLDQAIPLLEHTLIDAERIFGVTHPETLTVRNDLAAAYQAVGRLQEAEILRNHRESKT
jgi:tetratricopeptide (TPR) repeat protein